jgi:hypothetical protein
LKYKQKTIFYWMAGDMANTINPIRKSVRNLNPFWDCLMFFFAFSTIRYNIVSDWVKTSRPAYRREPSRLQGISAFYLLTVGLLCLTTISTVGSAATYYLDAVNGDDNNSGTSGAPWKSMAKVNTSAEAGDILIILRVCQETFTADWPKGITYKAPGVTQFGITWTFDQNHLIGRFANGDYWVVGPVTVIGIDPPSTEDANGRTMNGSMMNPSPTDGANNGYDRELGGYDHKYNVAFNVSASNPLIVHPYSSLVSVISLPKPNLRPQLKTAAVLTILDVVPPEGSFRPPYCGIDKAIKYNKNQLDYSKLAKLAAPKSTPELRLVERMFERVWLDHPPRWPARYFHPSDNMPDYGRDMMEQIGDAALILHLNFTNTEKETLLVRFVQLGIDLYGVLQDGGEKNWIPSGGHQGGRKLPILFAGIVLNDSGMKSIGNKSGDYLYSGSYEPGKLPPDYIHFQEDDQTFYVKDTDIYNSPYELHYKHQLYINYGTVNVVNGSNIVTGINTSWTSAAVGNYFVIRNGKEAEQGYDGYQYKVVSINTANQILELDEPFQGYTANSVDYVIAERLWFGHGWYGNYLDYKEYIDEHKGMPEWGIAHSTQPIGDGLDWNAAYRPICALPIGGHVLTAHIMNLKELWNHNALFDYMDRWMQIRSAGNKQDSRFAEDMWKMYRADYGPVWTMSPTLTVNIAGSGTVAKTPDKPTYELGEKVTLSAVPNPGFEFIGWSAWLLENGNPGRALMYASQTITAYFSPVQHP